mmetsp:Transcript_41685/g.40047  ORF Transcript_41685/g.40047 Transcript_41685/m.40047 type:complete len:106 (+) Transcript_41685:278-595(+)
MELVQVFYRLKKLYYHNMAIDVFELLILASYKYGNIKLTQKIMDLLKQNEELYPNAFINEMYFKHIRMCYNFENYEAFTFRKEKLQKAYDKRDLGFNLRASLRIS